MSNMSDIAFVDVNVTISKASLVLWVPVFVSYQLFFLWVYQFLKAKPILRKTIRDELFQQFCIIHLPTNGIRKLLFVTRVMYGPLPPAFGPFAMIMESVNFVLVNNFFMGMAIFKYLNVFHWSLINEVDELKVLTLTWTISVITIVCHVALELVILKHTFGTIYTSFFTKVMSNKIVQGQEEEEWPTHSRIIMTAFAITTVVMMTVLIRVALYKRGHPKAAPPDSEAEQKQHSLSISSAVFFCTSTACLIIIAIIMQAIDGLNVLNSELIRSIFSPILTEIFILVQDKALRRFVFKRLSFRCSLTCNANQVYPVME